MSYLLNYFIKLRAEQYWVGPAIIKDYFVYFDGQQTKIDNNKAVEKVFRDAKIFDNEVSFWVPPPQRAVVKQGGKRNLISYHKKDWTDEGIQKFKERLSHLHFKFIYESIYEEKFETSTLEEQ